MGGVAGHMSHLYDNPELTFKEMEEIFTKASAGSLIGTEKTDGQNIFLSYSQKDGKAKAARNLGNIKDGGLTADELAAKFKGRGDLEKSFNDAFEVFSDAVELFHSETQLDIFGPDANIWYNAEIQDPRTSNVINYDNKTLTIHRVGHKEFDKQSGKVIQKDVSGNAKILENALDQAADYLNDKEYRIEMNAIRQLEGIADDKALNMALSRLYNIISAEGLTTENTVGDYLNKRVGEVVDAVLPGIAPELRTAILKRIFKIKGTTLNTIYRLVPPEAPGLKEKIRDLVNKSGKVFTKAIWPLEDVVHDFSVEMLKGLKSAYVLDNESEVKRLKGEVSKAINAIENSSNKNAMEILSKHMKKLKDIDNVSTAAEGFVFDHGGVSYKFTGNFAPVNQLLGIFRYGRGDVPPMELKEEEGDVEDNSSPDKADIAFVPGSFKPPHQGHFELMKSYLKYANKVVVLISDPQSGDSIRFIDMPGNPTNKIEFTADASKRVFDIYIDNDPSADGKIEVWDIWNKEGVSNPIQYIHEWLKKVGKSGDKIKVALGVSTKDAGDEKRFNQMKEDFAEYPNIELEAIVQEPIGSYSADDMRSLIPTALQGDEQAAKALQKFLPDGVNVETLLRIVEDQPTWLMENKVREIVGLIDAPADYQGKELMFHEMMEFYMKAPEDVRNAFEEAIDTMTPEEITDYLLRWKKANLKETSSMAAGNVQGASGGEKDVESLIREEEDTMHIIDRKEFIEELALREHIRGSIRRARGDEKSGEDMVRQHIRKMIKEEVKDAPYKNTGINELENLLKKVIPVIEPEYKSLTTAPEQRVSYRAHILNAVKNALAGPGGGSGMNRDDINVLDAPSDAEFELEEDDTNEDININVGTDKFIDIDDAPSPKEDEEEEKESEFSIEGEEETGRNFASMTWDRIETNIVDSYRKLANTKDRDLFYDYLIANLKLYFDKFEDELSSIVDEPSSEVYDQEVQSSDDLSIDDEEDEEAELGGEEIPL